MEPLIHPVFDPIALQIGPLAVRWYGLMYLVGFLGFLFVGKALLRKDVQRTGMRSEDVDDLLLWGAVGVVLGGRLGYVFFYKPGYYLQNPSEILAIWEGGMAFHGGLLGVVIALALFSRLKRHLAHGSLSWRDRFLALGDFVAPLVPIGLGAGRLGNYINGELWGRAADPASVPWAMVFPQANDAIPRHPSQLYQVLGEGMLLFALLMLIRMKPRPRGLISGVFLMGYGMARFVVEFFREPDNFLGLLSLGLSMGQWLSLPMIAAGALLTGWALRQPIPEKGQRFVS